MCNNKKVLLIYNPYSGNGAASKYLDSIIEIGEKNGYIVQAERINSGIDLNEFFFFVNKHEFDRVIIVGGDGTINQCVNGIVSNDLELPIGIIPTGTANDFADYFHIPQNIQEQIKIAYGNSFVKTDIGVVNDRYFINIAALGAVFDVSQNTNQNLKSVFGIAAYYLKALTELHQIRSFSVTVSTPFQITKENIFFMIVMNGSSAGGLRKVSPSSRINDGKLDVILFKKMPIAEIGILFLKILHGQEINNKYVVRFKADDFTVESEVPLTVIIDGEYGAQTPLKFGILHERIKGFAN